MMKTKKTTAAPVSTPREKLGTLYGAARKGDRAAAKELFTIAHRSASMVEGLLSKDPELVRELCRDSDEFPVLRSWSKDINTKREIMVKELGLGGSLPLRAKPSADEFYRRVAEEMIPLVGLDLLEKKIKLPPLSEDPAVCRQWARAIVNACYPSAQGVVNKADVHPEDWRAAKKGAARSCAARQRRRKPAADSSGNIIRDLVRHGKRSVAEQITMGDFRTALIDKIVETLMRAVKEKPWHFHGF